MPWSKSKLPPAAKNLTDKQKEIFVAVANSVLKDTEDEGRAIASGLAAAKKEKDMKKSFAESLGELIEKYFGGSEQELEAVEQITKSVNEEQRLALFVVLEPQDGEETTDLHGDTYTVEEVEKACHNFNQHCMKANLFHKVETEEAKIVESYVAPVDFVLDDKVIKKGTWLQSWYFPETEVGELLWKSVKDGTIDGVSVGCRATVEEIDD